MPYTSPYDLIQKAARRITSADRWATIQANTQERTSVPESAPARPEPPRQTAPQERPSAQPNRASAHNPDPAPVVMQPPFAPPQARHTHLDEIAQRHTQAVKSAGVRQEWKTQKAQERPLPKPPAPPAETT